MQERHEDITVTLSSVWGRLLHWTSTYIRHREERLSKPQYAITERENTNHKCSAARFTITKILREFLANTLSVRFGFIECKMP